MSGFNWSKVRRESSRHMRKMDWYVKNKAEQVGFSQKMNSALKKYGWQKCPRCGGGRHPMFALCRKCRVEKPDTAAAVSF